MRNGARVPTAAGLMAAALTLAACAAPSASGGPPDADAGGTTANASAPAEPAHTASAGATTPAGPADSGAPTGPVQDSPWTLLGSGTDPNTRRSSTDFEVPDGVWDSLPEATREPVTVPALTVDGAEVPMREEIQVFADAIVWVSYDSLSRGCWRTPLHEPWKLWGSLHARGLMVQALAAPPTADERGVAFGADGYSLLFPFYDDGLQVACPIVRVETAGGTVSFEADHAEYLVQRLRMRAAGTPVNPADVEEQVPIICPGVSVPLPSTWRALTGVPEGEALELLESLHGKELTGGGAVPSGNGSGGAVDSEGLTFYAAEDGSGVLGSAAEPVCLVAVAPASG